MGQHSAEERDPGNSEPGDLAAPLGDDELAEVLALLAEIRDNQQDLRKQLRRQQDPGRPAGAS